MPEVTIVDQMTLTDNNETEWTALEGLTSDGKFPARARFGDDSIVIFRTKRGFRGTSRSCPHMLATMLKAELAADDTMVRCPLHVFTFRLSDGKGVNCPGFSVAVFEVKEADNRLLARQVQNSAARS